MDLLELQGPREQAEDQVDQEPLGDLGTLE